MTPDEQRRNGRLILVATGVLLFGAAVAAAFAGIALLRRAF